MNSTTYNPTVKKYEVRDSSGNTVESFPAGDAGRQAARETALKLNDPQAYATAFYLANNLFRHHQELHGRIWSATEIVAEGRVSGMNARYDQPNNIARINPQDGKNPLPLPDGDAYSLGFGADGRCICNCPDYQFASAPKNGRQILCKHIIAFKMMRIMGREIPAAPEIEIEIETPKAVPLEELAGITASEIEKADAFFAKPTQQMAAAQSRARSAGINHAAKMREARQRDLAALNQELFA